MKFAKIMVIIVIFVFAMSVSCAADTNNASISEDNSQMLLSLKNEITDDTSENSILAQTNNDETLSAQKNSEILRANEGTYSDLRDDIRNGGNLKKSYYRYQPSDGETIVIDTDGFTVNGNGAVIDMKGSTNMRAFYVIGSGVTFKNLTIKNANLKGSGGAIYFSSSGTVENCNFTANTATGTYLYGGAVYFDGNGNVSNCNFTDNKATGTYSYGGAVYFAGNGNVTNCNFTGNNATGNGSAVYFNNYGNVSNCNFTDNKATGTDSHGGAIYMDSGTVSNCNFTANNATHGGAVYFLNQGNVTNCNFTGNNATRWGGAVYFNSYGNVTNCNFTGNTATRWGGAVFFNIYGNVINCNFTNNQADLGGAVYFYGDGDVLNCNFTGNTAARGGAIGIDSGNVINCNFTGNTATRGGAVYFENSGNVINCNFTGNTATRGGAVYFVGTGDVRNCNFTGNNATGDGGAVYFLRQGNVINCNFTANNATHGGAVYFLRQGNVENCNFTGNTATDGNGGAIYFKNEISNSNINATFINNKAELSGGAIFFNGAVSNSNITGTYTNNNATQDGGANYFNSAVSDSNVTGTYTNNTADEGGANYFKGAVLGSTVSGTYTNNKANTDGGANFFLMAVSNSNITGTYTNNKAGYYDGANHFHSAVSNSNITGTYTNNKAGLGCGANNFMDAVSNLDIGGIYINNTATDDSIIYFVGYGGGNAEITNAIFLNNNCKYEISVYPEFNPPEVVVKDSWFGNNASNYMNKPKMEDKVQMDNWLFLNATSDYNSLLIMDSSNIAFKLYSTDGENVSDFDNSLLPVVNLSLTATNGDVDITTTTLDKVIKYTAKERGIGSVTASIENAKYTIFFDNIGFEPEFSAVINPQEIFYGENTTVFLSYNDTATGTVNIILTGKKHSQTIENVDLNKTIRLPTTILPDEYEVTVIYSGDGVFFNASATSTLTVKQLKSDIKVVGHDIYVNDTTGLIFTVTLPENATGNLTISNGTTLSVTKEGRKENNSLIIEIMNNNYPVGQYEWTFTYNGDDIYESSNETSQANILIIPTEITANATSKLFVDDTTQVSYNLTPYDAVGDIRFTSNDTSVVEVDDSGNIKAIAEGTALITVIFEGSENYTASSTNITITVSKIPTEINITNATVELKALQNISGLATLNPTGAGNLTYTSSDEDVVEVSDDGIIYARIKGTATVTVSFAGDGKYKAAQNKTIKVTVTLNDASIRVENDTLDLFVDDTFTIVANTTPKGLKVTYKPDNSGIISVDNNGVVTALKEGNSTIIVSVGDNKVYAENTTTVTVTVNKISTDISIANATVNLNVDDEVSTGAKLNPEEAGNLTYTSSDENIAIVKDGKIIALKEGDAIITVSFKGNNKYGEAKNKTIKVTVKKLNPSMNITADEITEGENATINVELPIDATGNVTTTVNGKTYSSPVDNGKAIITIPDLEYGNYTLPVTYSGDDKYNPLTKDVNLTVKEDEIVVSAPDLTKYYSGNERFTVNVAYANGRAIAGKEIKIAINGVTYKRTTDENGSASLSINLNSATYDTVVEVDNISVNSIVTILPTIEAEDVGSKSKNIVFSATFIDGKGNYLKEGTDVSFNIGGIIYNSQVTGDKGRASVDLVLNHGRYIITSFNSVSNENVSNSIAVDLKDADMILSGDEISVGDNATIIVTLPDDATGNVTATINGKTYTSQVDNGKANIIIPDLSAGNYTAHVTYSGDNNYNHATGNISISVSKIDPIIDIEDDIITVGENATVIVILPGDATGDVRIGNEIVPLKNGTASAILTGLPVGINTIPVTYSGDDKYNPIESSADVVVNDVPAPEKKNLTIEASADEITEGEDAVIVVTGLENATGNVSAVVHGHVYSAPIVDGTARITVSGLADNATASVSYAGDDIYNPAVTHVNITVNKNVTAVISAENLTKYYKDSEKFTVKITDAKGQPAANKTVEITINGVTYKRTTDENGTAGLNINLNSGVYPVRVVVDGVEANFTVTVQSTIDSSDIVKIFRNGTQYNAIFTDANGTPLPNIKVSFNLHGIIYNRTTDKNGAAKLNINLDAGDYIITAFNSATGEMKSNTIKVISLIESDELTKYYKNASQFVVRIHTSDGGYVGAGEEVKFNINGVIYTRTTNATGHAKLNINLHQGNYTITTYYKDCSRGNNIEVLPILTAEDLSMKYMDGSQFKAQLVDGKGNPYPKQTVTFNINGVFYNRVTDSDGQAKLNIRLMAGQYIITSGYNGCNISNKITISA